MEINKETKQVRELCVNLCSNVLVEGDIIIPDVKPDVREILLADAVASVKNTEERNGILYVSGNVRFQILYIPDEEGCGLKSLSAEFPFSDAIDIPGTDACDFMVTVGTEHIAFAIVNSRKLSMKVIASLKVRGYRNGTITTITDIPEEQVQCKSAEYHLFMPICEAQKSIAVSDLLALPPQAPDIDEILKTEAWVGNTEYKTMNGKVMMRGVLHFKTLYAGANEISSVEAVSHEIPFSEILEMEGVDENSRISGVCNIKELTESPRGDMNGDTKMIHADAVIEVSLRASASVHETWINDCYCTSGTLETVTDKKIISELVMQEPISFSMSQQAVLPKGKKVASIVYASAKPILRETYFEDGAFHMKGTLVTFLLYRENGDSAPDAIRCAVTETELHKTRPAVHGNLTADCELWAEDITAERMGDGTVEMKVQLSGNCCILRMTETEYICDMEIKEREAGSESCPMLVVYFIREGDTLWNIAKAHGTTVEKIKKANHMNHDMLSKGEKLLIPKVG